jgi:hypothetical protein
MDASFPALQMLATRERERGERERESGDQHQSQAMLGGFAIKSRVRWSRLGVGASSLGEWYHCQTVAQYISSPRMSED